MFGLERIANWWEEQHQESERALQDWVDTSRSDAGLYLRAAVATAVHTSMVLGAGLVDVLRLGEGIRRGGWGYAQDGLRLLSLAGPVVRLGRLGLARWTFNPRGDWCASVATARVLRQTGTRLFVKATEVIQQTGGVAPTNLNQFIPFLRTVGARFREVASWRIDAIETLVQGAPRSVVLFGVRWTSATGATSGHALYAYRDALGLFRIADRTGAVVSSLSELNHLYPGIGNAVAQGAALVVHNATIVEGTSLASMLAIEVNGALTTSANEHRLIISPAVP